MGKLYCVKCEGRLHKHRGKHYCPDCTSFAVYGTPPVTVQQDPQPETMFEWFRRVTTTRRQKAV